MLTDIFNYQFFISFLYIFTPVISGAILSAIDLAKRYPTVHKYIFTSLSGKMYLLFTSLGSLLISYTMRIIGTQIINNELLNPIFLGLIGSGVFLGIISKVTIHDESSKVTSQIKPIRDYIYEYLYESIERLEMKITESKIREITDKLDPELIMTEANRLIGGLIKLDNDQKYELKIQFDKYEANKDYDSVIRDLIKNSDVDYIIGSLKEYIKIGNEQIDTIEKKISDSDIIEQPANNPSVNRT